MIVKGNFESVSLAIYGKVADAIPTLSSYEPRELPSAERTALCSALDPSNSADPTMLALQLLSLNPNTPSLELIIRLMLCLKVPSDDWDLPEFPYLYFHLEELDDLDLESIYSCMSKPIPDSSSYESRKRLADRIADLIGPKVGSRRQTILTKLNKVSEPDTILPCSRYPLPFRLPAP